MTETTAEQWLDHDELEDESAHLMESERYQKGGRDTVIVVWTLIALATIFFLLCVAAVE